MINEPGAAQPLPPCCWLPARPGLPRSSANANALPPVVAEAHRVLRLDTQRADRFRGAHPLRPAHRRRVPTSRAASRSSPMAPPGAPQDVHALGRDPGKARYTGWMRGEEFFDAAATRWSSSTRCRTGRRPWKRGDINGRLTLRGVSHPEKLRVRRRSAPDPAMIATSSAAVPCSARPVWNGQLAACLE